MEIGIYKLIAQDQKKNEYLYANNESNQFEREYVNKMYTIKEKIDIEFGKKYYHQFDQRYTFLCKIDLIIKLDCDIIENIGELLIKNATILVGGHPIQELPCLYRYAKHKLENPKLEVYKKNISNEYGIIQLPLNFYFSKGKEYRLPLHTFTGTGFQLQIEKKNNLPLINKIEECFIEFTYQNMSRKEIFEFKSGKKIITKIRGVYLYEKSLFNNYGRLQMLNQYWNMSKHIYNRIWTYFVKNVDMDQIIDLRYGGPSSELMILVNEESCLGEKKINLGIPISNIKMIVNNIEVEYDPIYSSIAKSYQFHTNMVDDFVVLPHSLYPEKMEDVGRFELPRLECEIKLKFNRKPKEGHYFKIYIYSDVVNLLNVYRHMVGICFSC